MKQVVLKCVALGLRARSPNIAGDFNNWPNEADDFPSHRRGVIEAFCHLGSPRRSHRNNGSQMNFITTNLLLKPLLA